MHFKRGQLTIFILIAVVIVGAVVAFFAFRNYIVPAQIPATFEPAYNSFLSCVETNTQTAIGLAENQGGYVNLPQFEPGSTYMPFSSQLDFLGNPIPYWYYVSGNNIEKEQVPSQSDIENQIGSFIDQSIKDCRLEQYYDQGLEIKMGDPKTSVNIRNDKVDVSMNMDLTLVKGDERAVVSRHSASVNSNLGALYNSAIKIYNDEQRNLFLENYTMDALGLYAPVDGVELSCSPLTWDANKVFSEVQNAIDANIQSLKTKTSLNSDKDYFVEDVSVDGDVRFLTSKNWTYSFDVVPSQGGLLLANPIGNQPSLGILGFCYVPYHFVYNVKYPVLVQIISGNEVFQFPTAVIIQGNNPRHALNATAVNIQLPEICDKNNTEIKVNVYDTKLSPINNAEVSYECFGTKCDIGKTTAGILDSNFPQCVNGDVIVKANGFKETRYQFSTVNPGSVDIIVDKTYPMNINLKIDGVNYNGQATISFTSDDGSILNTIVYPNQKTINLSEGQYEVQVSVYQNSSLKLGATSGEQCLDVPQSGAGGFFGFTKQKCFTIDFPEQIVSNALSGGGKQNYYILEYELSSHNVIEVNAQGLKTPTSIDDLNNNYLLFDQKGLQISFK